VIVVDILFKFNISSDMYIHVKLKEDFIEAVLDEPTMLLQLKKSRFGNTVKLEKYDLVNKVLAEFSFETKTMKNIFYEQYKKDPWTLYHELVNTFIEQLKEKYPWKWQNQEMLKFKCSECDSGG